MMNDNSSNSSSPSLTPAQVLDGAGGPAKTLAATPSGAAPQTTPSTPAADDKVSAKLQLLIDRENRAVQKERTATTKEQQLAAKEQLLAAREAKITEFENLKATNPRKALELLGMSYQDLTQVELNDGEIPPELQVKKVEEKLNGFLKSQEAAERQKQEDSEKLREQQAAQAVSDFKGQITTYLKENVTRYELIEFEQSQDLVYDVIDEQYNRTLQAAIEKAKESGEDTSNCTGEIWTISQAADKVEEALEKKYDKARNLNKVKTLLAPRQAAPSVVKPQPPTRQTPKTLTNNHSATPAVPRKSPRTDEERVQAALAYYAGLRPAQ